MDLTWLTEAMSGLPSEFRFILILVVLGITYKFLEIKYLNRGEVSDLDIQEQIANIEKHVTNHLSHDLKDISAEIKALSSVIRDLTEQTNRNVNTMNVVLAKQDQTRDMLIELRGEIRRNV